MDAEVVNALSKFKLWTEKERGTNTNIGSKQTLTAEGQKKIQKIIKNPANSSHDMGVAVGAH
jgi:hypothetical protein